MSILNKTNAKMLYVLTTQKGLKEFLEVMKTLHITCIVVMASQAYVYVQTYQIVYIKYEQLIKLVKKKMLYGYWLSE